MPSEKEIEAKFWKALKSDMTVMLGLRSEDSGHPQPMTAQLRDEGVTGPVWFFTASDVDLVKEIGAGAPAMLLFASKGHDLFASVEGSLALENDRSLVDELWNPFAAAWYEEGKNDPKLRLIRFDPGAAQIWLNENSLFAGAKMLLGIDPKRDYQDKVAEINLMS